jgi:bifunctional UDP-N-acetylglucosamine pyrophosphorylase/glucosamine-1-phosphate N-acetyltransferase
MKNIDYYFKKPEKFPIAGFLDGITYPHEILTRAKDVLNATVRDTDTRENHGELRFGNDGEGNAVFHGEYFIGEGTTIYNGVTIIGPVYIGRNCEILPGAILRPYTILGDGCSVGHGSELKHTVMYGGAKVASLAFVGDSVLGASARIGSGVITANRKFDQTIVSAKLDGEKYSLETDYFGLILGDASRLGANCVSQPGTHIGSYTWVFPSVCVRDFIPERVRVMEEARLVFSENPVVELKP